MSQTTHKQVEILREEHQVTGCPFCDGCGRQIGAKAKTFYKFFWRKSGQDQELHSHTQATCVGKVMAKVFV